MRGRCDGMDAGRQLTVAYRITEFEPSAKMSATGTFAFLRFSETFGFQPTEDGTRVNLRNEMEPKGIATLGTPLWRLVLGSQIRGDNRRLKQVLEARSDTGEC